MGIFCLAIKSDTRKRLPGCASNAGFGAIGVQEFSNGAHLAANALPVDGSCVAGGSSANRLVPFGNGGVMREYR